MEKRKSAVSAPGLRPVRSGALRGALSDDFSIRFLSCRSHCAAAGAGGS
jgi:hypothetical protein